MKIKVIAIAPFDGWAFIVKNEQLYLLRPPYQSNDLIESSENDLAIAVSKYRFQEFTSTFDNLSEVIHFLGKKYTDAVEQSGIQLPAEDELKSLLEYASEDILLEYLHTAEEQLIPYRNLDAAESIAVELLRLDIVKNNDAMFSRAVDIIDKCREERQKLYHLPGESTRLPKKFPNAIKAYTENRIKELMAAVFARKQLLPIGM